MTRKAIFKYFIVSSIALIVVSWLYYLWKFGMNLPRTADDLRFFLHQFSREYLEVDSVIVKIQYLFSISNWPHTKIVGRTIQVLQYHVSGDVNFKYISFIGNLLYLPLIYCLSKMTTADHYKVAVLLLASWFLVPIFNSYWPIFSVSFAGNLLISLLILWSGMHKKMLLFMICSVLSVFVHGHIIIVPFITVALLGIKEYLIDRNKLSLMQIGWIVISLIAAVILFYLHILESPIRRQNQDLGTDIPLLKKLATTTIYVATYLTRTVTELIFSKSYHTSGLFVAVPIVVYAILTIIRAILQGDRKTYTIIGMIALCVVSALLAGWVRNDGISITPTVAPRYECWSIVFFALLSILSIDAWKLGRMRDILVVLAIGIYIFRMFYEVPQKTSIPKQRINYVGDIIGDFKKLSAGDKIVSQRLKEAISKGIYHPPFKALHEFELLKNHLIKAEGNAKIEVIKHSRSSYGEYLTIGFNSKIVNSENLSIYWSKAKKTYRYEPLELSTSIGLKQGFDKQLNRPNIPHLQLMSCLMPPNADEIGVLLKKKDHYVKLKTIIH